MKNNNSDGSTLQVWAKCGAFAFGLIVALLLFCGVMLYGAWAGAFVGSHLWLWFVVPTFGLAPLTMPQAFGISLLISFWTYHFKAGHKDEREFKEKAAEIIGICLMPWITLLIGFICYHFFM